MNISMSTSLTYHLFFVNVFFRAKFSSRSHGANMTLGARYETDCHELFYIQLLLTMLVG